MLDGVAMDARTMIAALLYLALGAGAGVVHLFLLRRNAALYARPGARGPAVALQVLRFAGLALLLVAAARLGKLPLLMAGLGMVAARPALMGVMAGPAV
jgi:hypothetical protein